MIRNQTYCINAPFIGGQLRTSLQLMVHSHLEILLQAFHIRSDIRNVTTIMVRVQYPKSSGPSWLDINKNT